MILSLTLLNKPFPIEIPNVLFLLKSLNYVRQTSPKPHERKRVSVSP